MLNSTLLSPPGSYYLPNMQTKSANKPLLLQILALEIILHSNIQLHISANNLWRHILSSCTLGFLKGFSIRGRYLTAPNPAANQKSEWLLCCSETEKIGCRRRSLTVRKRLSSRMQTLTIPDLSHSLEIDFPPVDQETNTGEGESVSTARDTRSIKIPASRRIIAPVI